MKSIPTGIPEKLRKLAADISANGNAELTRLTVLKKWFEQPRRLAAFAIWMGQRAISQKGEVKGEAAGMFRDASRLLKELDPMRPVILPERLEAFRTLYERMKALQNVYRYIHGTQLRMVENWDLVLVEQSLELLLRHEYAAPTYGYRLAADYCKHYDSRYGDGLNGPSKEKIIEIARFTARVEAWEGQEKT